MNAGDQLVESDSNREAGKVREGERWTDRGIERDGEGQRETLERQ